MEIKPWKTQINRLPGINGRRPPRFGKKVDYHKFEPQTETQSILASSFFTALNLSLCWATVFIPTWPSSAHLLLICPADGLLFVSGLRCWTSTRVHFASSACLFSLTCWDPFVVVTTSTQVLFWFSRVWQTYIELLMGIIMFLPGPLGIFIDKGLC